MRFAGTLLDLHGRIEARAHPAGFEVDPPLVEQAASALEERRARLYGELERRVSQEPGVTVVTFANRAPDPD